MERLENTSLAPPLVGVWGPMEATVKTGDLCAPTAGEVCTAVCSLSVSVCADVDVAVNFDA